MKRRGKFILHFAIINGILWFYMCVNLSAWFPTLSFLFGNWVYQFWSFYWSCCIILADKKKGRSDYQSLNMITKWQLRYHKVRRKQKVKYNMEKNRICYCRKIEILIRTDEKLEKQCPIKSVSQISCKFNHSHFFVFMIWLDLMLKEWRYLSIKIENGRKMATKPMKMCVRRKIDITSGHKAALCHHRLTHGNQK